jgi:alpha-tubulin suppressor-like RCC1 family protein
MLKITSVLVLILIIVFSFPLTPVQADGAQSAESKHYLSGDMLSGEIPLEELNIFDLSHPAFTGSNCNSNSINLMSSTKNSNIINPAAISGTPWAWGDNSYGQLGNGTTGNALAPTQVIGLSAVASVAGGECHSLALKTDGTVWAWGWNNYGQLGDATTNDSALPMQVSGLSGVIAISGKGYHNLALKSDGTVWAWGSNYNGQLGNGSTVDSSIPEQVSGLSGVIAIAGGTYHSLALKSNGTVWAWGDNSYGELGDRTSNERHSPVQVSGLSSVIAIASGSSHSLALRSDGTVWTWGSNNLGELGYGSTGVSSNTPTQVSGLSGVTAIAGGEIQSLALKSDGSVWAWGLRIALQTGGGIGGSIYPTPAQVSDLNGITAISAGEFHGLAIKSDGKIWGWGHNYYGQLGNGTNSIGSIPTVASGLDGITGIAGGRYHSLACSSDGSVWSWGWNFYGQLGNGKTGGSANPAAVSGLSDVVAVAAGVEHSLISKSDGTVWGWGSNDYGQLGNGTTNSSYTPVQASSLTGVIALACGYLHSLALKSDGTVWAWGYNSFGQLGNGTYNNSSTPVQVNSLNGVIAIAEGVNHCMALKSDGSVWNWGYNNHGQLGDGTFNKSLVPLRVSGLNNIIAIAAGGSHSLALKSDGTVWAWGYNHFGQLGMGISGADIFNPVQVSGLSGIIAIAGGMNHSLALKSDGTVWTWGYNSTGQLGNGTTNDSYSPLQVTGLSSVTAIAGGYYHSLALKAAGTVWGWGYNYQGQLGNGTYIGSLIPMQATSLSGVSRIASFGSNSLAIISPPTEPNLTSPADGATVSGTSVTFQWSASSGATNYWLVVVKSSDGSSVINKAVGNVTTDVEFGFPNDGTQYKWVVAAGNGAGWSDASLIKAFTNGIVSVPPAPSLTSPADGSTVSSTSVTFQWSASSGATNYWLAVIKASDNSVIVNKAVGNVTSDTESGFPNDGTAYKWVVAAGNGAGWGNASTVRSFTSGIIIVPTAPALTSPADGATVSGASVTFQWSASRGATNYWLAIVKSSDNSVIVNKAVSNVTSDTETGFPNDGTAYKWVVAAGNSAGWSGASAARTFTNGTVTIPSAPSLTSPADGATVSGTSVTFQWAASSGATNYWLAVVKASDNSVIVNKAVGNVTSSLETGFTNNGTQYRWVVAAGNNAGWGSASAVRSFTNGTAVPAAPSLVSPADGAKASGTTVTFQWAASSGATNYWLAVTRVSDNSVIVNKAVGNVTSDIEAGFPNNGTQYRWVVAAGNSAGWGSASTTRIFTNGP